jgi:16S rRNA (uracil1498-N3)-methyltransferase
VIQLGEPVTLEIGDVEQIARARAASWLVGAPERGRADWLVEKLAELGVGVFQPIETERARWLSSEVRLERWGRLARAALRQSRRCHELVVHPPRELAEAMTLQEDGGAGYLADPGGTPAGRLVPKMTGGTVGVVGPAEGFSTEEREWLTSAGFVPISLSDGRLRTETAAIAMAGWWSGGA